MEICKLCLTIDTSENGDMETPNKREIQLVQNLIPQLNIFHNINSLVCFVCTTSIKTIGKFLNSIIQTEQKIETALPKDKSKLDIKSLHPSVNALPDTLKSHVAVCRLCLKFIAKPSIFLCENETNILGHEHIKQMLQFCNVNLNFNISEKPTICTDCWEILQTLFTFKKNCLEVEEKLSFYCKKFNLQSENIDNEILRKIHRYFLTRKCKQQLKMPSWKLKKSVKTENTTHNSHIVMEHDYISYFNDRGNLAIEKRQNKSKYEFTETEDRMIMTTYLVVTKNEQEFPKAFWNRIFEIWKELNPESKYPKYALVNRFRFLKHKGMCKSSINQLKSEVAKKFYETAEDTASSSEDEIESRLGLNKILTVKPEDYEDNISTRRIQNSPRNKPLIVNNNRVETRIGEAEIVPMLEYKNEHGGSKIKVKSFALERDISSKIEKINPYEIPFNKNEIKTVTATRKQKESEFKKQTVSKNINSSQNITGIRNYRSKSTEAARKTNNVKNKMISYSVQSNETKKNAKLPILKSFLEQDTETSKCDELHTKTFIITNEPRHSSRLSYPIEYNYHNAMITPEKRIVNNTNNKHNFNCRTDVEKNLRPNTSKASTNHLDINNIETVNNREVINPLMFEETNSNSDDSFIDEAHCSLEKQIKVELLNDSDIEICVDELKAEVYSFHSDSDDSLPELERMDIPPMNFQIDNSFSLDNKKEMFDTFNETNDPDINVEQVSTCRRFLFKNQPIDNGQFKCLECNFETKHRTSATIHSRWHSKIKSNKKLHECTECPYRISNLSLLRKHMQLHKEENEIPELLPWT